MLANYRLESKAFWGSEKNDYGDMYSLCYLPKFKIKAPNKIPVLDDCCKTPRDKNLYVLCDSYLFNFVKTNKIFNGVKNYWFARWNINDESEVEVNTRQKNVLLLESTERFLMQLADSNFVYNTFKPKPVARDTDVIIAGEKQTYLKTAVIPRYNILQIMFNPRINNTLEFHLFDYRWLAPLKEIKANLNYNVFNRVDKDVVLSPKKDHLFFNNTVNKNMGSSFKPMDDQYVEAIVKSLNAVYAHYKAKGFKEVYFSVIPNPVNIVAPQMGDYNNLIPRIQNHPDLKIRVIDAYSLFQGTNAQVFHPSDTHWNNTGFSLWVREFNKNLATL